MASYFWWGMTIFGLIGFIAHKISTWLESRESRAREALTIKKEGGFKSRGKDAAVASIEAKVTSQSAQRRDLRRRNRLAELEKKAKHYGIAGGQKLGVDSEESETLTPAQEIAESRLIRQLQDEAYQRSLEADRKKQELDNKRARNELEAIEKLRAAEALLNAQKSEALDRLGAEPEPQSGSDVCMIRLRLPNARKIERKVKSSGLVQQLYDLALVNDFHPDKYEIFTAAPKVVLNDPTITLESAGIIGRVTVYVGERLNAI